MAEVAERLTLGKQLRQISTQAKANKEAQVLVDMLKEAASNGETTLFFEDLNKIVPTMVMNDTLWDWLKSEEIGVAGDRNQDTGALSYQLSW